MLPDAGDRTFKPEKPGHPISNITQIKKSTLQPVTNGAYRGAARIGYNERYGIDTIPTYIRNTHKGLP